MNITKEKIEAQDGPVRPTFLLIASSVMSVASLIWTAYSIHDLLRPDNFDAKVHLPGLAVALTSDIIWSGVLYAEWKGIRLISGTSKPAKYSTPIIGWIFLFAVVGLLVWHGMDLDSPATAVAGPLLPIGAKVLWLFTISASKDPAALTLEEQATINEMMRASAFDAAQKEAERVKKLRKHEDRMADIQMQQDEAMAKDNANFKLKVQRFEHLEELDRRTPAGLLQGTVIRKELEAPDSQPQQEFPVQKVHHSTPVPTLAARNGVTVPVELTPEQQANKLLAAEYYLREPVEDTLTQTSFAGEKGISGGQLSKVLRRYKPHDVTQEEWNDVSARIEARNAARNAARGVS